MRKVDMPKGKAAPESPQKRRQRSEDELDRAMSHLCYEVVAVSDCASLLQRYPAGTAIGNAALEAQLVHARLLTEFFFGDVTKAWPDDIIRTDFDPTDSWHPGHDAAAKRLKQNRELVNKHVAHLSWTRVDEGEQQWQYPEIADDVLAVAESWANHLATRDQAWAESFAALNQSWAKSLTSDIGIARERIAGLTVTATTTTNSTVVSYSGNVQLPPMG
jgi:hypothetical protein